MLVVTVELGAACEDVVEGEVFVWLCPAVVLTWVDVVVPGDDEAELSGQKVIRRLTLFSWHAIWTQVSSGARKAALQLGESHVAFTPSHPS